VDGLTSREVNSELVGNIEIKDEYCVGCGYCVHFCYKGCITITGDTFTPQGYLLPVLTNADECTGCGVCAWMCPQFAIDVYRCIEGGEGVVGGVEA
jgi:2-oxoglutarate ferredoxin oxidoreductase subunit delta